MNCLAQSELFAATMRHYLDLIITRADDICCGSRLVPGRTGAEIGTESLEKSAIDIDIHSACPFVYVVETNADRVFRYDRWWQTNNSHIAIGK